MMMTIPFPTLCLLATEVEHQNPQTKPTPKKHQQQKEKRKGKKGTRRTNEKICESEEVVFNVFVTIG